MPGIVHFWGPYPYRSAFHADAPRRRSASARCSTCATSIMVEGAAHHRRDHPRDRWSAPTASSCRRPATSPASATLCDEHGIVLIADEVMAGFGRCGEWFAVDHWGVTPDLITFAKGVNSGYVPLGGVVISDADRRDLRTSAPTPAASPTPATRSPARPPSPRSTIFKEEGIIEHARAARRPTSSGPGLRELAERHPSRRRGPRARRLLGARAGPRPRRPASRWCRTTPAGAAAAPMGEFAGGVQGAAGCGRSPTSTAPTSCRRARPRPTRCGRASAILDEALDVADRYYTG